MGKRDGRRGGVEEGRVGIGDGRREGKGWKREEWV